MSSKVALEDGDAPVFETRAFNGTRGVVRTVAAALIMAGTLIFTLSYRYFNPKHGVPEIYKPKPPAYVGLSLSLTHAAAAISFGNATNHTVPVNISFGDENYRATFDQLSQWDARHPRPPYYGCPFCGIAPAEKLRQLTRSARKKVGLPATSQVGVLAEPLKPLIAQIDAIIAAEGFEWSWDALLVTPAVLALYDEDIRDIVEYLGLTQVVAPHTRWPYDGVMEMGCQGPYEAQAAFAAAGMGVCTQWWDFYNCQAEMKEWDFKYILAVEYTKTGLVASRAGMRMAQISDGYYSHMSSSTGLGAYGSNSTYRRDYGEMRYWQEIFSFFAYRGRLDGAGSGYNISDVFIFGESADGEDGWKMEQTVRAVIGQKQVDKPVFHRWDPWYSVAIGAAELAKRGGPSWLTGASSEELKVGTVNPDPLGCPWFGSRVG